MKTGEMQDIGMTEKKWKEEKKKQVEVVGIVLWHDGEKYEIVKRKGGKKS